ncbi:hypothetical protein [Pelomonas sp. KK5]|uniref:hypothetical protein n=1 Tax=Pelomonas sp. KK5 TaxID=1855730 RepID=UPI00097BBF9D|nr:hypothetical protein [Pelomonas sp. KK5]
MRIRFGRAPALATLASFFFIGGSAFAAGQCPFPDATTAVANYDAALARLKLPDCLGDRKEDKAPVVARFDELTNQPINLGQTERLIAAVDALTGEAEARASESGPLQEDWRAMLQEFRNVRAQLGTLGSVQSKVGWLATGSEAVPAKWRKVSAGMMPVKVAGRDVDFLKSIGCTNNAPCDAFQSQLDLVRLANLMARLAGYLQSPSLADQYADAKLALAQWEAYRTKAHHQYIWEVWVNGLAMGKDLCPVDAGTGMKMGFCKVPQSQWILLHPDAALRFSNSATKSSELKPALLVEILGRYSWNWKAVNGSPSAEMESRMGYSLAATYTSTNNEKAWGFGPMVHLGDYSFALTKARGGGRWSVVVNIPLADKVFARKQEYVDALQKVKKEGLADLLIK